MWLLENYKLYMPYIKFLLQNTTWRPAPGVKTEIRKKEQDVELTGNEDLDPRRAMTSTGQLKK